METSTNTPQNKPSLLPVIAVIAVFAIIGILLASKANKSQPMTKKTNEKTMTKEATPVATLAPSTNASDSAMSEDVKTVNVEAGSFYYKPDVITVKKGQKVRIVMKAVSMMHDFNIDELGVKLPITKDGETNTVEFTPEQTGTFEYYCSVGQHRKLGQVGKITVE